MSLIEHLGSFQKEGCQTCRPRSFYRVDFTKAFDPSQPRDNRGRWARDYLGDVESEIDDQRDMRERLMDEGYERELANIKETLARDMSFAEDAEERQHYKETYTAAVEELEERYAAMEHVTMLHGTTTEAMDSILRDGIVPQGGKGADAYLKEYRTSVYNEANIGAMNKGSVFVTTDSESAWEFAEKAVEMVGGEPVIIAARIPVDYWAGQARSDYMSAPGLEAFRFSGPIKSEWLSIAEKAAAASGEYVTLYFTFLVDGEAVEKAFNPSQPRDDHGRWTTGGAATSGIVAYLNMVSGIHGDKPSIEGFILKHGRPYPTDAKSHIGGTPHECYKNATLAVMANDNLTYVEGYIDVHGVPIHHAWAIDETGVVRDYTIENSKGIRGYYGVPINTDYMMSSQMDEGLYGVLTHNQYPRLMAADPAEVVQR